MNKEFSVTMIEHIYLIEDNIQSQWQLETQFLNYVILINLMIA